MSSKASAALLLLLFCGGCSGRNRPSAQPKTDAVALAQTTRRDCGVTWSLTRGDEAGSGRFVTGAYPEEGEVYPGFPDQNQIDRFIQRHSSVLQRRENVFGTWCVTPAGDCYAAAGPVTCYLDISRETATLEEAAQLAKDCNQISVAQLNQPKVAIIFFRRPAFRRRIADWRRGPGRLQEDAGGIARQTHAPGKLKLQKSQVTARTAKI